jgi:hypothetical protein
MTSTVTNVTFFTKENLCCTNSLLMKHIDALKLNNVWVFIVVDLLHFITIGSRKQSVGFEYKMGPFWRYDIHWGSILQALLKLNILIFQILLSTRWWRKWHMLSVNLASFDNCQLCELILHNTSNICLHVDVFFLVMSMVWIKSYQFAWGGFLVSTPLIGMVWRVWNSFVLATTPHTFCNNVWRTCLLSHQITCAMA